MTAAYPLTFGTVRACSCPTSPAPPFEVRHDGNTCERAERPPFWTADRLELLAVIEARRDAAGSERRST
jgi:hypothetical protein